MGFGSVFSRKKSSQGFSPEELEALVESKDVKPKKKKVGTLTRIGNVLSAFEPGGELATLGRTGDVKKAGKQYLSEIGRGLGSALPFLDKYTKPEELSREREGFKEVSHLFGVPEKGPWDDLLGLAGDILLDPGNLLLAPLFAKGARAVGKVAEIGGEGIKKFKVGEDAINTLGKMFIPNFNLPEGYKTSKQLYRNLLEYETLKTIEQGAEFTKRLPDEKEFIKVVDWLETGGKSKLDEKLLPVAKELQTAFEGMKKAEKSRGILKAEIPDYFPHIKKEVGDVAKVPFEKPLKVSLKAKKPRQIEGIVSEINESFGKEFFMTNPAAATTIRGVASKKAVTTHDFLKSVEEMFGVQGKTAQVIDGVKHIPFQPEGAIRFYPAGDKAVGVTKKVKTYLLPEEVAKDLQSFTKALKNEASVGSALRGFDKLQNFWKKSVTAYFPAFHARNAFSNFFVNWLAGMKEPRRYQTAMDIVNGKTGKVAGKSYDEVLDLAKRQGVLTSGFFEKDIPTELARRVGKQSSLQKIEQFGSQAGRTIENNARLALFIDRLEKGDDVAEATRITKKFLFDYGDLTGFEKEVMKRIFPFYTWTRKAIPLMAEQLVKQPVKYKAVFDIINNLQSGDLTEKERKYIPDYIKKSLGIQIGRGEEGSPLFLASLGLPIEVLEKPGMMGETGLSMMSPILKYPLERATGRNFFTDKDLETDPFLYQTKRLWGEVPIVKQFLQVKKKDDKYYVNPIRMHFIKTMFGRIISTGEKLSDKDKNIMTRLINSFSGAKIYGVDTETQKYFQDKEESERYLEPLMREGEVGKFERFFVPKSKKNGFGAVFP